MSYKTIVSCILDGVRRYFEFDALNNKSISGSVSISTFPIVSKDTISDHLFREPKNLDINADFSLNGHQGQGFDTPANRLGYIEDIFERIENEGILCDIYTIRGSFESGDFRFKQRNNMCLNSHSFDEKYNGFSARLSFREIMSIDIDETIYEVDVSDPTLPALTDPLTLDFTDTMLNKEEVIKAIIAIMMDEDLISEEFWNHAAPNFGKVAAGVLTGIGVGVVISLLTAISLTGVGLILLAVGAAAALIIVGVKNLFDAWFHSETSKLKKDLAFKYKNNQIEDEAEQRRFVEYIAEVYEQLDQLETAMKVLGIGSNEEQELCTYIDNTYYLFTFNKNEDGSWKLVVTDIDNNVINENSATKLQYINCITDCNHDNKLFRTKTTGKWVYLMFKSNSENQDKNDLRNYCIMISDIDMLDFNNVMTDILKNAIIKW